MLISGHQIAPICLCSRRKFHPKFCVLSISRRTIGERTLMPTQNPAFIIALARKQQLTMQYEAETFHGMNSHLLKNFGWHRSLPLPLPHHSKRRRIQQHIHALYFPTLHFIHLTGSRRIFRHLPVRSFRRIEASRSFRDGVGELLCALQAAACDDDVGTSGHGAESERAGCAAGTQNYGCEAQ